MGFRLATRLLLQAQTDPDFNGTQTVDTIESTTSITYTDSDINNDPGTATGTITISFVSTNVVATAAGHGLSDGDNVSIKKTEDTVNTTGTDSTGYNANYTISLDTDNDGDVDGADDATNKFRFTTADQLTAITNATANEATVGISSASTAFITTAINHGYTDGSYVTIAGITSQTGYNGTYQITVPGVTGGALNTFSYAKTGNLPTVTSERHGRTR